MNLNTLYKKLTNGKYIIGLLIGFIGSISFGYCDTINVTSFSIGSTQTHSESCNGFCCFSSSSSFPRLPYLKISYGNIIDFDLFSGVSNSYPLTCLEIDGTFSIYNGAGSSSTILFWDITDLVPSSSCPTCPECPTCPTCPEVPSCPKLPTNFNVFGVNLSLSGYDQVVLDGPGFSYGGSSIITNQNTISYVVSLNNDLTGSICTGDSNGTGDNWSALFINDIQYPGAPTIKFTIPEEIQRDQNTDEEETNIDVIGYGYDQDKMQQMVNTQYYKPTAEEMSGLMEKVADFLPLVAVALLITRIRRVLKKVFKF